MLRITRQLISESCCGCGIEFAMPADFQAELHKSGTVFYCPCGHPQHYTDAETLQAKLEKTQERLAAVEASARRAWEEAQAEADAAAQERHAHGRTKAALTITRKRVEVGVCPYCHRNFIALGRHVRAQHPEVRS